METGEPDNSQVIKAGRPPFEPSEENRELVQAMTVNGVPAEDVAKSLGISQDTLRKYFSEELDYGRQNANARVAKSLFRKALQADTGDKGAVTAAIFWLKTRAGWREEEKPQAPQGNNLHVYVNSLPAESQPQIYEQLRSLMYALRGQKELGEGGE